MIKQFKNILKAEGISLKGFSDTIGMKYGSIRTLISGNKVPRWIKSFNFGYIVGRKSQIVKDIEVIDPIELDECPKCGMDEFILRQIGCRDEECQLKKD